MLNVRPPSQPIRSLNDFLIHIATIVVGLLIAIGLEQAAEHFQQRRELYETTEALDRERQANNANLSKDERNWLFTYALLKNDLLVLRYIREHPGVPQSALPGVLGWIAYPFIWDHAVWDAAVARGVTRSMALQQANEQQEFYGLMSEMAVQSLSVWDAINDASRFDLVDADPTHLTPSELSDVIQKTEFALAKHVQFGYSFGRYAKEFPGSPHRLTYDRLSQLRSLELPDDPALASAQLHTREAIDALMGDFGLPKQTWK